MPNTSEPLSSRGPSAPRGEVRARLLAAAKEHFSAEDYSDVTIRAIAQTAKCDPGLVAYYFGSKVGLFREAMSLPRDPVAMVIEGFNGPRRGTGERIIRSILDLWEEASASNTVKILLTSILANDVTKVIFSNWVDSNIIDPVANQIPGPNPRIRAELAMTHVIGILAVRYLYELEPLASEPHDALARRAGPIVDAILWGKEPSN